MSLQDRFVGELVTLFTFDFRSVGGGVLNITNNSDLVEIEWDGLTFMPNPVTIGDLKNSTKGALPNPEIQVSNLTGLFTPSIILTGDLVGGIITRYVVDAESLGTSDAPVQPAEVFMINNSQRGNSEINLSTTTQLGTWNVELPTKRMLIRDYPALGRVYK